MIRFNRALAVLAAVALMAVGGLALAAAVSNINTGALATGYPVKGEDGLSYAVNTGVYGTGSAWAGQIVCGSTANGGAAGFMAKATSVAFPDTKTAELVFVGKSKDGRKVIGTETITSTDPANLKGSISVSAKVGTEPILILNQPCAAVSVTAGSLVAQPDTVALVPPAP